MKMKFLRKLLVLMAAFAVPSAWAGGGNSYARLTANVSSASPGSGLVYAGTTATENTGSYRSASSTATSSEGDGGTVTLYAFAYPTFGKKFTGWSTATTTDSDSGNGPTTPRATFNNLERKAKPDTGTAYNDYYTYARFEDASSQIVDIFAEATVTESD